MIIEVIDRYKTEVSSEFLQGMASRMMMSYEKYGAVAEAYPHKIDALASLDLRLARYRETGNTEHLMDAANFLMIEYMHPRHAHAHFKAEDSVNSPGRQSVTGVVSQEANTIDRENMRRGGTKLTTGGGFYKGEGD